MDQAQRLREMVQGRKNGQNGLPIQENNRDIGLSKQKEARVIVVTSGKGGVGKTNVAVNLAYAFIKLGKTVCILDADMGLANIDILLGLTPKYNLKDVILDNKSIEDIMIQVQQGLNVIPASSGIQALVELDNLQRKRLIEQLSIANKYSDIFIIDTAAGISSNVLSFVLASQESIVITTPEPTSLTDVYAVIKLIANKGNRPKIKVLVNMVVDRIEAEKVFNKLNMIVKRFLDIDLEYLGYVSVDDNLPRSVMQQKPVFTLYPRTAASKCIFSIASKLNSMDNKHNGYNSSFTLFWRRALNLMSR